MSEERSPQVSWIGSEASSPGSRAASGREWPPASAHGSAPPAPGVAPPFAGNTQGESPGIQSDSCFDACPGKGVLVLNETAVTQGHWGCDQGR